MFDPNDPFADLAIPAGAETAADLVAAPQPRQPGALPEGAVSFIKGVEGFTPKSTWDVRQWSVGYGTRGQEGETLDEITADRRLRSELTTHAARVDAAAQKLGIPLDENKRSALISFDFNSGQGETALQRMAQGGEKAGLDFMSSYLSHDPALKQGVANRRAKEIGLFTGQLGQMGLPTQVQATPDDPFADLAVPPQVEPHIRQLFDQALAKTNAAANPPPDTSFVSAFKSGIDQPLEAMGTTAQVFGAPQTGEFLKNLTAAPVNYESAGQRFMQPQQGDFTIAGYAPRYLPRAGVEQAGQLLGSIASREAGRIGGGVVGAGIGAAGGAFTGPGAAPAAGAGWSIGSRLGSYAGPFFFQAMQIAGPTALERAKNNGRTQPNKEDIVYALTTAAGSGALDSIGARFLPGGEKAVGGIVRKIAGAMIGEGVTETSQSFVEQAGETAGTKKGLTVSPKQAFGEGVIGAFTGGGSHVLTAPFHGRAKAQEEEQPATQSAQPPPLPSPEESFAPPRGYRPPVSRQEKEARGPQPFAPTVEGPVTEVQYGRQLGVHDVFKGRTETKEAERETKTAKTETTLTKSDLQEIVPALEINGEPVAGEKNDTHEDIMDRLLAATEDDKEQSAIIDAFGDDSKHVFTDKAKQNISRDQLEEWYDIRSSQQLRDKQKSETKKAAAEPVEPAPSESPEATSDKAVEPDHVPLSTRSIDHWRAKVEPVLEKFFKAFDAIGRERLERANILNAGESATDFLMRIRSRQPTWDKGRKIGSTGIQMLSAKDLWPTNDATGETLRKTMLAAIRAINAAPGYSTNWIAAQEAKPNHSTGTDQPAPKEVTPDETQTTPEKEEGREDERVLEEPPPVVQPEPEAQTPEAPKPEAPKEEPPAPTVEEPVVEPADQIETIVAGKKEKKAAERLANAPDTSPAKLKVQKAYLLDALDKALKDAPDRTAYRVEADADTAILDNNRHFHSGDTKETFDARRETELTPLFEKYDIPERYEAESGYLNLEGGRTNAREGVGSLSMDTRAVLLRAAVDEAVAEQQPKIEIEVPGDGTFRIVNTKDAIRSFTKIVQKGFPTAIPKAIGPPKLNLAPPPTAIPPVGTPKTKEDLVKVAGVAASEDQTRFVLVSVMSDGAHLIATDGRRLLLIDAKAGGTEAKPVFFDPKTGKPKKMEGNYPNWKQVIPKAPKKTYSVETAPLLKLLIQAQKMTDEKSKSVKLWANRDGSIGVSANTPDVGEFEGNVQPGAKTLAAFDPQYLIDALNAARKLGNEKVTLGMIDEMSPVQITAPKMKSVVMPMRINFDPFMVQTAIDTYRRLKDFAKWSAEMVRRLGEAVRPHLAALWKSISGQNIKPQFRESGAIGRTGEGTSEDEGPPPLGIKNALTEQRSAEMGLPALEQAAKVEFQEGWDQAAATLSSDSKAGERLIKELLDAPRTLDPRETGLLLHETVERDNEYEAAIASGDRQRVEAARQAYDDLRTATKLSGTEQGRSLAFRKMLANRDYTLAKMSSDYLGADETKLSRDDQDFVKDHHEAIKEAARILAEAEKKQQENEMEAAFERMMADWRKETKQPEAKGKSTMERLKEKADAAKARVRARLGKVNIPGLDPQELSDWKDIAVYFLANKAMTLAEFTREMVGAVGRKVLKIAPSLYDKAKRAAAVLTKAAKAEAGEKPQMTLDEAKAKLKAGAEGNESGEPTRKEIWDLARAYINTSEVMRGSMVLRQAVLEDLKQIYPNLTEDRVVEIYSEYGKETIPSQETDLKELRRLRQLGQLELSIRDLQAGKRSKKTGFRRDKPDDELRSLMAQRQELLRQLPPDAAATASQHAGVNERKATALRNRIRDLKTWLETGVQPETIKKRSPVPPNATVEDLTMVRDAYQEKLDEIEEAANPKESPEERKFRSDMEDVQKSIAELDRQLTSGDVAAKPGVSKPVRVELEQMRNLRDAMARLRQQLRNEAKPKLSQDDRQRKALLRSLEAATARFERLTADGRFEKQGRFHGPFTQDVQHARNLRDAAFDAYKAAREMKREADFGTPEERKLAATLRGIQRRTAALEERLAKKQYEKPEKPAPMGPQTKRMAETDEEIRRARIEQAKVQEAWHEAVFEKKLKDRTLGQKIFGGAGQAVHLSRSIMTSADFSGVLRQGGFITFGHPILASKSVVPMLRAMMSEEYQRTVMDDINNERENAKNGYYKKSGIYFADPAVHHPNKMEEAFQSRWSRKLPRWTLVGPMIRGSERAYTTFLNKLRADTFDAMVASLSRGDVPTDEELKAVANFINIATGRGTKEQMKVANKFFFAPSFVLSRMKLAMGTPLYGGSMRTRRMIAFKYVRAAVGVSAMLALLGAMRGGDDDDLEGDPRSTDFLKRVFGQTHVDLMFGVQSLLTTLAKVIGGRKKTTGKGVVPLREGPFFVPGSDGRMFGTEPETVPYGGTTMKDVAYDFTRSKLNPLAGTTSDILLGKEFSGKKITVGDIPKAVGEMFVPMGAPDILQAMKAQDVPRGTALSILSLLGAGVRTYQPLESEGGIPTRAAMRRQFLHR